MRFNLRGVLVVQAILAVAFAAFIPALDHRSDKLAFLVGATICAALIGAFFGAALRLARRQRFWMVLGFATVAGVASASFVVQSEWHSEFQSWRPGKQSDALYSAIAIVRCGLVGCAIGWIVALLLQLFSRDRSPGVDSSQASPSAFTVEASSENERSSAYRVGTQSAAAAALIAIIVVTWAPYWPYHQRERALRSLLNSVERDDVASVRQYAWRMVDRRTVESAVGRLGFLAMHGGDARVRRNALEAWSCFPPHTDERLLRAVLTDVVKHESDEQIHTLAVVWLKSLRPVAGSPPALRPPTGRGPSGR